MNAVANLIVAAIGALGGQRTEVVHQNPNLTQSPQTHANVTFAPEMSPHVPVNVQVVFNTDGKKSDITSAVSTSVSQPQTYKPVVTQWEENGEEFVNATPHTSIISINRPRPWKVGALITGGSFLSLFYLFRKTEQILHQPHRWCNWSEDVATQKLAEVPQEILAQQLITAIQQHYTATRYVHDFVQPLKFFLSDVEQESAMLKRYIYLGSSIQHLWLGKLFGISDLSIKYAEERLTRLEILKKAFTEWAAEYKFERSSIKKNVARS